MVAADADYGLCRTLYGARRSVRTRPPRGTGDEMGKDRRGAKRVQSPFVPTHVHSGWVRMGFPKLDVPDRVDYTRTVISCCVGSSSVREGSVKDRKVSTIQNSDSNHGHTRVTRVSG